MGGWGALWGGLWDPRENLWAWQQQVHRLMGGVNVKANQASTHLPGVTLGMFHMGYWGGG